MLSFISKCVLRGLGAVEGRLSIVLFHRVLSTPDPMLASEPDTTRFAQLVQWLNSSFTILPLHDALDRLYSGKLPSGAVSITFDDGYRDNALNALPVLAHFRVPATFFVTTRYMEGGLMWNDRVIEALRHWPGDDVDLSPYGLEPLDIGRGRAQAVDTLLGRLKYLPFATRDAITEDLLARCGARYDRTMMNADEIRQLHQAGMEIGGHTVNHPILTALDDETAAREINDNKAVLESVIGAPVETFAYPNGRPAQDYDGRHVELVRRAGYRYALTTAAGTSHGTTDPWQIPRFTPWDRQRGRFIARMIQNYFRNAHAVERAPDAAAASR